jgi:hypothetical protein
VNKGEHIEVLEDQLINTQ